MISAKLVMRILALAALALWPFRASAGPPALIDHIILGVSDLDAGIEEFERRTGVRPAYGGKHPTGTHNALVSLGDGTYLEIIAVQPGVSAPPGFSELAAFKSLTPIGWAVSASDIGQLRSRLATAGVELTDARQGSRTTPSGATLRWHTLGLKDQVREAPFFIVWSPDSPHPSSSSPPGCSLARWSIAGPNDRLLERLRNTLQLPISIATAPSPALHLTLTCPSGSASFASPTQRP